MHFTRLPVLYPNIRTELWLHVWLHQQSLHPLLRTSQVSLSSNPETDFRYSAIYGTIGVYKGRIFAIKMVNKKSIDMTRSMKKELKWVSDPESIFSLAGSFRRNLFSLQRMCTHNTPLSVCV